MKKTLLFCLSMCLILLLAACGSKEPADSASESAPPEESGQKIASLSIHVTNNLLALGIQPAGSVVGGKVGDFLPHVADQLKGTEKLGEAKDVNMEALLALEPDLILVDKEFAGQDLSKYEGIAPVEVIDLDQGTWRDHLTQLGKLLDRESEASTFIEDYDQKAQQVKSTLPDTIKSGTAMAIRINAKELRVFTTDRPLGPILFDDLDLTPAKGIEELNPNEPYEVISQEVLPDFEADTIFVVVDAEDDAQQSFKEIQQSAIWQGLKAVKQNQVFVIKEQPWLDYSAVGNKMALDEAQSLLSK